MVSRISPSPSAQRQHGYRTKAHDDKAGVHGAVLIERMVRIGDDIEVLD
jgi:hypothetical protein